MIRGVREVSLRSENNVCLMTLKHAGSLVPLAHDKGMRYVQVLENAAHDFNIQAIGVTIAIDELKRWEVAVADYRQRVLFGIFLRQVGMCRGCSQEKSQEQEKDVCGMYVILFHNHVGED